ncbi:MAG: hypothetical protein GX335_06575 [Firmicutes bacterium]|nr:hypothetical protein [Bacillota bacterium]
MGKRKTTKDRRKHLPVLFVFLGAVLFVNLFSSTNYHSFSLGFNLELKLGYQGYTRLVLPPIGEIRAKTHWFPARLSAELKSVDLGLLRKTVFVAPESNQVLQKVLEDIAWKALILFGTKLVLLGAGGALFGLWLSGRRKVKQFLWAAGAGLVLILVVAAGIFWSYDLDAFENPEYEGIIEAAPWVLNMVWEALDRVEELGERIQVLAQNLYSALNSLENLGPLGFPDADLVVLHVSDIHNNPIAYDFAKQVIESFPVNFVLDTGDLTDWGTALEAEITTRIKALNLPYLFTSGNHDSPEVLERLAQIPNAVIVEGREQILNGLRIVGMGDLVADRYLPEPAPLGELKAKAVEINEKWSQIESRPHIFMIHNHRIAKAIEPGLFPVVVYGHTHILEMQQIDSTVYINAGTTGAAGIRGFQSKEPLPYSLSLLYFVYDEEGVPVLIAVDGVHVAGLGLSFSLQRTFIRPRRNPDNGVEILSGIQQ